MEGYHIYMWGYDKSAREIKKPYTPISHPSDLSALKILVKVYKPNEIFEEGGKLTQWIEDYTIGDMLTVSGPVGKCEYLGLGQFHFKRTDEYAKVKKLTLIGGGTGFTPFFQLLKGFQEEKEKSNNYENLKKVHHGKFSMEEYEEFNGIEVSLLDLNKTEDDILLPNQLIDFQDRQVLSNLKFSVDKRTRETEFDIHFEGQLTQNMLESVLWEPADDHWVFYCGKTKFRELTKTLLERMGYTNIFQY